jgi:hypothetical protein
MNAFVREYISGKVSKDVFYGVLKALINESDDRSQSIAIYGLTAVPSYESYEILSLKIDEKSLKRENQSLSQKAIDDYSTKGNTKILLAALKSSQEIVTLQGLHGVGKLIENSGMKSQNIELLNERQRRGSNSKLMKKDSYSDFVNTLQGLTHDNNAQIAILAENTLQQFTEEIRPRPIFEVSTTQSTTAIR